MARSAAIPWVATDRIADSVQPEPVVVLLLLALAAWVGYKVFLRNVNSERHNIFREGFRNLSGHIIFGLVLYGIYELSVWLYHKAIWSFDFSPYVGFITIIWACIIIIKITRIVAYEYLFLTSMRAGVPLLIVNILTLILSVVMTGWVLSKFMKVDLAPLLATSAIFSIVLGLALQDTLGNLFAGIALQIDKPFEIGDWIEAKNGSDKVGGQVLEISWRATMLLAITDEIITIPNRSMAQWQISNFAGRKRPFVRSHVIRLPYNAPIETAKAILLAAASAVPGVASNPPPVVIVTDSTESWIAIKVVYNIVDYGSQFGIADRFLTVAIAELADAGIELATQKLTIESEHRPKNSAAQ